jgi:hypothetical protein
MSWARPARAWPGPAEIRLMHGNESATTRHPSGTMMSSLIARHPLAVVFGLALAVRLINVALLAGNAPFFAEMDADHYWELGGRLAAPGAFWPALLTLTYRMPLYPLLLAGVQSAFGEAPRVVAFIQALADAGTCTLIAGLGSLVSPQVGLLAGLLAALSVTLVVLSTQILTDTIFLFFFTAMLLAGARFLLQPSNGRAALAGLAGGMSLAIRPAATGLLAAAVPLVLIVVYRQRRRLAPALVASALFAVAAALPAAPVWIRNIVHFGSFHLTAQGGDHLLLWIAPLVLQRADGTPYQAAFDRVQDQFRRRLADHPGATSDPFRFSALKSEVAREAMAGVPYSVFAKAWAEGMVVNLAAPALLHDPRVRALPKPSFYHTPGTSLWERARAYLFDDPGLYQAALLAGLVATIPFLLLEAVGFVMLARAMPWAAVLAGGVLAYFLLISGPVAGPKYRMPMEPVLIVLAAIPLARLMSPRGGKSGRAS